ncbi:hypothetical protein PR048_018525 [Dryococelus australis]|uniref:Uncharacterized protein n=1 Tax=Dryococelus australis TaxID=614101 RepID=A0ABQ9HCQ3_9NEOP|nr:hypothetical protein PR048_018525 [Dryococelus australis]
MIVAKRGEAGMQCRRKREIPEQKKKKIALRLAASSVTIPTCEGHGSDPARNRTRDFFSLLVHDVLSVVIAGDENSAGKFQIVALNMSLDLAMPELEEVLLVQWRASATEIFKKYVYPDSRLGINGSLVLQSLPFVHRPLSPSTDRDSLTGQRKIQAPFSVALDLSSRGRGAVPSLVLALGEMKGLCRGRGVVRRRRGKIYACALSGLHWEFNIAVPKLRAYAAGRDYRRLDRPFPTGVERFGRLSTSRSVTR